MLYCITIYCQFASYCANKAALQKHNGVNLAWLKTAKKTSAIAEGPRDAFCQLKLCQLLDSCIAAPKMRAMRG